MKQIKLSITALSALSIGRQKPGSSVSETEDYIPGSVLRGAISHVILERANLSRQDLSHNGGDFQQLFLDEKAAIFHNAYPAITSTAYKKKECVDAPIYCLPSTVLSSKTNPGFKTQGKNGVFDTLIDRFCADELGWNYDPVCPEDGQRVDPYATCYSCVKGKHYPHSVTKRFLTRVGINRRRATAEDEILYSIQVINEQFARDAADANPKWEYTGFRGEILIEDDALANRLIDFINANQERFRLGGSTSRGLGKVKIVAEETAVGAKGNSGGIGYGIQRFQTLRRNRESFVSSLQRNNVCRAHCFSSFLFLSRRSGVCHARGGNR